MWAICENWERFCEYAKEKNLLHFMPHQISFWKFNMHYNSIIYSKIPNSQVKKVYSTLFQQLLVLSFFLVVKINLSRRNNCSEEWHQCMYCWWLQWKYGWWNCDVTIWHAHRLDSMYASTHFNVALSELLMMYGGFCLCNFSTCSSRSFFCCYLKKKQKNSQLAQRILGFGSNWYLCHDSRPTDRFCFLQNFPNKIHNHTQFQDPILNNPSVFPTYKYLWILCWYCCWQSWELRWGWPVHTKFHKVYPISAIILMSVAVSGDSIVHTAC